MPGRAIPTDARLADELRARAHSTPDALCWIAGDRQSTWAEAWRDVQGFAGALAGLGVRRGDRIGFLSPNDPAILVAMFAVSLLGAADVVLDPRITTEELHHVLAEAELAVLFVRHDCTAALDALAGPGPRTVLVGGEEDELGAMITAGPLLDQQPEVTADDPCLVLYSSGTTGRPKGIVLTQRNLLLHTRHAFEQFDTGPGDRLLLSNVMFHSCALHAADVGATGIITPDLMPPSLVDAVELGLTHAFFTPAAIRRLEDGGLLDRFEELALVAYGTAPMPAARVERAMHAWPDVRFLQLYGLTECVAVLTVLSDRDHRTGRRPDSCGRPIRGVEVRVVDPDSGVDVDDGTGELWFRTDQMMAGYFGNPEETAKVVAEGGWIRTGDIGRVDQDGFVFVEDRLKDLVLVNGWNVVPAQVERILVEHPDVEEAAVFGVPDERWGEAVKAVVTARPGRVVGVDDVIEHCRVRLSEHKVPTIVEVVETFPRNPLGKILKRALRDPHWAATGRLI